MVRNPIFFVLTGIANEFWNRGDGYWGELLSYIILEKLHSNGMDMKEYHILEEGQKLRKSVVQCVYIWVRRPAWLNRGIQVRRERKGSEANYGEPKKPVGIKEAGVLLPYMVTPLSESIHTMTFLLLAMSCLHLFYSILHFTKLRGTGTAILCYEITLL